MSVDPSDFGADWTPEEQHRLLTFVFHRPRSARVLDYIAGHTFVLAKAVAGRPESDDSRWPRRARVIQWVGYHVDSLSVAIVRRKARRTWEGPA